MLSLLPERLDRLLLLGAHCDDIAIGAGGTLLELCRAHPGLAVTALVLSGGGIAREEEERAALAAFCPGARARRHRARPARRPGARALGAGQGRAGGAARLRRAGPRPRARTAHDAHQDHRTLAEAGAHRVPRPPRARLRDPQVGGRPRPAHASTCRSPSRCCAEKVAHAARALPARQRDRTWFDAEAFSGLARIRGVQCHARYAEAFHVTKMVLGVAPLRALDPTAEETHRARSADRPPGLPGHRDGPGPRGRRATTSPGLDSGLFADCVLGELDAPDVPGLAVDLRDVTRRPARRVRRRGPPGGAVQRPARLARPGDHLRHQPPRLHPAGPARQGRRRAAASSTPPPARCTARSPATTSSTRTRRCAGHPVRGVQGARRGRPARAGRRRLRAGVHAQRHRVRLLPAAARRHRAQQPRRPRGAHRRGPGAVRRHPVAPAGARRGHRRRLRSPRWPPPPTRCTAGRSTSAPSATTSRSPRSPQAVVEAVPGREARDHRRDRQRPALLPRRLLPRPQGARLRGDAGRSRTAPPARAASTASAA